MQIAVQSERHGKILARMAKSAQFWQGVRNMAWGHGPLSNLGAGIGGAIGGAMYGNGMASGWRQAIDADRAAGQAQKQLGQAQLQGWKDRMAGGWQRMVAPIQRPVGTLVASIAGGQPAAQQFQKDYDAQLAQRSTGNQAGIDAAQKKYDAASYGVAPPPPALAPTAPAAPAPAATAQLHAQRVADVKSRAAQLPASTATTTTNPDGSTTTRNSGFVGGMNAPTASAPPSPAPPAPSGMPGAPAANSPMPGAPAAGAPVPGTSAPVPTPPAPRQQPQQQSGIFVGGKPWKPGMTTGAYMKTAKIDPMTVARYGLGGAMVGGSLASVISLAHAINLAKRQRKELNPPDETDENTIVLTLPGGKQAEVKAENGMPVAVRSKASAATSTKRVPAKSYRAGFYPNQKMKKANWQTLTASVLAATGGSMLGYHVINKAYQNSLSRKLKAQEEAARMELLDAMSNPGAKTASAWLESNFVVPTEKTAQFREKSHFSYLDAPMAVAALMTLLGTGGTAYITKKILDQKLQEQEKEFKPPKVQRIVFKSAAGPLEPGEEQASAEDLDCVKCALAVIMDNISGDCRLFSDPEILAAVKQAGTSPAQIYKWANTELNPLVVALQSSPQLRRMIQERAMAQHPILKHLTPALKVPGLSHIADKLTYDKVRSATDDTFGVQRKLAGFVMPSFVGSVLAEKLMAPPEAKKAPPPDEEVKAEQLQEMLNNIQLSAKDPNAAAYLEANQDKIRAVLGQLAASGKLTPKAAATVFSDENYVDNMADALKRKTLTGAGIGATLGAVGGGLGNAVSSMSKAVGSAVLRGRSKPAIIANAILALLGGGAVGMYGGAAVGGAAGAAAGAPAGLISGHMKTLKDFKGK